MTDEHLWHLQNEIFQKLGELRENCDMRDVGNIIGKVVSEYCYEEYGMMSVSFLIGIHEQFKEFPFVLEDRNTDELP